MASVLSVLLLGSTTLPLILQVCCEKHMSQTAEQPCPDTMAGAMQDMPDAGLQKHMSHDSAGVQDDCCVIQAALPISASLLQVQTLPQVLQPVLLAVALQPPRTAQPPTLLADTSPPAPPLSLHLLNGSFLN